MKIVIGVDGSEYGRWAAGWVARLPVAKPVRVTAVHTLDLTYLKAPFMAQNIVVGHEPFLRKEVRRIQDLAKRVVKETKGLLKTYKLLGNVVCKRGSAAATIFNQARRGGLIVMGSRGLDAMDRLLLGSVSTQVVTHAPCSVLIVKEPPRPGPSDSGRRGWFARPRQGRSGSPTDLLASPVRFRCATWRFCSSTPCHSWNYPGSKRRAPR